MPCQIDVQILIQERKEIFLFVSLLLGQTSYIMFYGRIFIRRKSDIFNGKCFDQPKQNLENREEMRKSSNIEWGSNEKVWLKY